MWRGSGSYVDSQRKGGVGATWFPKSIRRRNPKFLKVQRGIREAPGRRAARNSDAIGLLDLRRNYGVRGNLRGFGSVKQGISRQWLPNVGSILASPIDTFLESAIFSGAHGSDVNDGLSLVRGLKLRRARGAAPTFCLRCNRGARGRRKSPLRRRHS